MKASVEKLSEARLRLHRGASPGAAEKLRSSYDELTDIVARKLPEEEKPSQEDRASPQAKRQPSSPPARDCCRVS
jgi:hypothetical protein